MFRCFNNGIQCNVNGNPLHPLAKKPVMNPLPFKDLINSVPSELMPTMIWKKCSIGHPSKAQSTMMVVCLPCMSKLTIIIPGIDEADETRTRLGL
jgi:hypothetical protein